MSGSGANERATITHPMTCSCALNGTSATIVGYTPQQSDVGHVLTIGTPYNVNGGTQTTGAGGSSGLDIRVTIQSVSGQIITFGSAIGTSPSTCQAAVSGADCELGTDNGSALQTAANAMPSGGTLCVPPGQYMVDTGVGFGNITLYCESGAVFYDPRADAYQGRGGASDLFEWGDDTSGGANGCVTVGTNNGFYADSASPYNGQSADLMQPWYSYNSQNLTFQNLVDVHTWADADVTLTAPDGGTGSNNITVKNVFTQGGWAYGPSVIAGNNNILENNIGVDLAFDTEPNDSSQVALTYGNTYVNNIFVNSGTFIYNNATPLKWSQTNSVCNGTTCSSTQTVTNNVTYGNVEIFPACSGSTLAGTYTGNTHNSNSTGNYSCGNVDSNNCSSC